MKILINYETAKAEAGESTIKCNRVTFVCDSAHFNQCVTKNKKMCRNLSILTGISSFVFVALTIASLVTLAASAGFKIPPEAAIPFLAVFGLSFSAENRQRPYTEKLIAADYILKNDRAKVMKELKAESKDIFLLRVKS